MIELCEKHNINQKLIACIFFIGENGMASLSDIKQTGAVKSAKCWRDIHSDHKSFIAPCNGKQHTLTETGLEIFKELTSFKK